MFRKWFWWVQLTAALQLAPTILPIQCYRYLPSTFWLWASLLGAFSFFHPSDIFCLLLVLTYIYLLELIVVLNIIASYCMACISHSYGLFGVKTSGQCHCGFKTCLLFHQWKGNFPMSTYVRPLFSRWVWLVIIWHYFLTGWEVTLGCS